MGHFQLKVTWIYFYLDSSQIFKVFFFNYIAIYQTSLDPNDCFSTGINKNLMESFQQGLVLKFNYANEMCQCLERIYHLLCPISVRDVHLPILIYFTRNYRDLIWRQTGDNLEKTNLAYDFLLSRQSPFKHCWNNQVTCALLQDQI